MIKINNVVKNFSDIKAVDGINADISEGSVFGLVGTNGAGKSTLMRMLAGVLKPDSGQIIIDGMSVYENEEVKKQIIYISDEQYFFPNYTADECRAFYAGIYDNYDNELFDELIGKMGLDKRRKVNTFSKGMKKQLSIILGVCAHPKYLLCDETFDGLDPVMRQAVKKLFIAMMEDYNMTPIIASHNLRELEDICEHVGLLHKGGILFNRDLEEMKLNIHKVQCIFKDADGRADFEKNTDIMSTSVRGSMYTYTIRGGVDEIRARLDDIDMIFYELLPLSLEEIFISETEVVGYDIKNIID
ncbi:MAG: ABC transporter ATP-binding protein [Lachnospiraceae bacterium]|nr:ABC transporter ATP-binding protein [Lachnospiraceae bacterium]